MARLNYMELIVYAILIAISTAIIGSGISYLLALISQPLGPLAGLVNALILTGIFVLASRIRMGEESFTEVIPVMVISVAIVELIRSVMPIIPSILVEFTWTNLAIVLSSLWLSNAIVKEYVKI